MKIAQITPGSGGRFYCENCLRDKFLVQALSRLKEDVVMVPMYLPLLAGGAEGHTAEQVFFGGLNVFLQQKFSLFRHTPRWFDRLFDASGILRWITRFSHLTNPKDLGQTMLSMLEGDKGHQAKEVERLCHWLKHEIKPDMVVLSNLLLAGLVPCIKNELGVPVASLLQGEENYLDAFPSPYRERAWKRIEDLCGLMDGFIASSHYYGKKMQKRLGLPAKKIHTAYNGLNMSDYPEAQPNHTHPAIGFLSPYEREKGVEMVVQAFIQLKKKQLPQAKLLLAGGDKSASAPLLKKIHAKLKNAGFDADTQILSNPSQEAKKAFLSGLSCLCVPSQNDESFGMYMLEAMACGVPVVGSDQGILPEILSITGGGKACDTRNARCLANCLSKLLTNPAALNRLGKEARKGAQKHFTVEKTALAYRKVLYNIAHSRPSKK